MNVKNKYCHIGNQDTQVSPIGKFFEKAKNPKRGTKNTLFE